MKKDNFTLNKVDMDTPREIRIIEGKINQAEKQYDEYIKKGSPEMALFFLARATAFKEVLTVL